MSNASLKSALREAIDRARPDGTYDEDVVETIHTLMGELAKVTPIPRPIDQQDQVAGPWRSLFAQFGPKHTAGKPIEHETSMKLLTFGKFPAAPIRLLQIEQEIHHHSKDYNNVQVIAAPGGGPKGGMRAHLIVYGRYALEEASPQRYIVDFHRIALKAVDGADDDALRQAFGLDADTPLEVEMKPPALHSDVVYCDEDMRINLGSMGGAYVMERSHHTGYSVDFA